jgi:hypothetical protein
MKQNLFALSAGLIALCSTNLQEGAQAAPPVIALEDIAEYQAPPVAQLSAETLETWEAPEARQGVAVDETFLYALDNTVIGKYRRDDGTLVDRFAAPRHGLIRHMNSCLVLHQQLWCANSNYSQIPHGSSVETFDTETMSHAGTHSLGLTEEGSLTWFDAWNGGWIAGFAHYSGKGGVPFKGSAYSSVATYDAEWRRTGGWLIPDSVIARMAPYAASGGALGPDGLLYMLGHDRPEMYVMARPVMGPTLIHVATIALDAPGQAFSFTPGESRDVFAIDRAEGVVRRIGLPVIPELPEDGLTFR